MSSSSQKPKPIFASKTESHTEKHIPRSAFSRIAEGKFSIKMKLVLGGLKLYGWLQRKAGWDDEEPPVQVYKNGKLLKPEDWSPELKEKYGYTGGNAM